MTKLLISVRSADEAEAALAGRADWIDVKEPRHGSLGQASANVLREVAEVVAGRVPLSAALGELHEAIETSVFDALTDYDFAKIGLAGAAADPKWRSQWANAVARIPANVAPVGVVYADAQQCNAPAAEAIFAGAVEHSCCALLLDTFYKDGRNLFDHWPPPDVRKFIDAARAWSMTSVLAGSLDAQTIPDATMLQPDVIAVRSAACDAGRTGPVSQPRVAKIAAAIRAASPPVGTTN